MRDYLLFIDTEASGLPKKWNLPYEEEGNWPNAAQVSWLIYTAQGNFVKEENYYISDNDFEISDSAYHIHGLTRDFLQEHGRPRKEVLLLLTADLDHYKPLIIGHFIELDFHFIGADSHRAGIKNPLSKYPTFCTMLATTHLVKNPSKKYLKLCDLYDRLFNNSISNYHNAMQDAEATAQCFFELLKRGDINEQTIEQQQKYIKHPPEVPRKVGCNFMLLAIFVILVLILQFL